MRAHRSAFVVAALAATALAWPGAALATDATAAEVRALAARAAEDPDALDELRRIDSVDGRPVDLAAALEGEPGEVAKRLETLAEEGPVADVEPDAARADAADILDERRFREPEPPRPFRRPLEWLGDQLETAYDSLADVVPGGDAVLWTILAGLVVLAAVAVSLRLGSRRRGRSIELAGARRGRRRAVDPAELERRADAAEQTGDLEGALRLRFLAGLVRLERAKAIPTRESVTSGEISRRLRSADFDELATAFDEVVYGGRPAEASDVRSAREGWPRVLQAVRAR